MMAAAMQIKDLARITGASADTIRYYEREGLLPPPARAQNNWRAYGAAHVQRLAFIRQARALGMSLTEIGVLLRSLDEPQADCGRVNRLVDEHIAHISDRIRQLRALRQQLKDLRARCAGGQDVAHCGILSGLNELGAGPATAFAPAAAPTDACNHPDFESCPPPRRP